MIQDGYEMKVETFRGYDCREQMDSWRENMEADGWRFSSWSRVQGRGRGSWVRLTMRRPHVVVPQFLKPEDFSPVERWCVERVQSLTVVCQAQGDEIAKLREQLAELAQASRVPMPPPPANRLAPTMVLPQIPLVEPSPLLARRAIPPLNPTGA